MTKTNRSTNPELRDLLTESAGAVTLHETRETDEPVVIEPGSAPGAISDRPEASAEAVRQTDGSAADADNADND